MTNRSGCCNTRSWKNGLEDHCFRLTSSLVEWFFFSKEKYWISALEKKSNLWRSQNDSSSWKKVFEPYHIDKMRFYYLLLFLYVKQRCLVSRFSVINFFHMCQITLRPLKGWFLVKCPTEIIHQYFKGLRDDIWWFLYEAGIFHIAWKLRIAGAKIVSPIELTFCKVFRDQNETQKVCKRTHYFCPRLIYSMYSLSAVLFTSP